MTTLRSVKKRIESLPCAFTSPKKLCLLPPNGKNAIGAATPMLTPMLPAFASYRNLRADANEKLQRGWRLVSVERPERG